MTADLNARLLEAKAALRSRGVTLTPRRERLLEVLVASDRHPSVSEVHREVKRLFPRTSLATVYNTIELLKEAGQVLEIQFSSSANRYDGRRPEPHPHLICPSCESIEDLDSVESDEEALSAISAATGYQIVSRRTDYYGICPDCQAKTEAREGGNPERAAEKGGVQRGEAPVPGV